MLINRYFSISILLLISIGLYLPTLQYGFVYDDKFQILDNKWITDIKYVPDVFSSSVWSFDSGATSNIYRPLMHVIYMLEYYLFGLKPWGYHLVNILLHALNTVIVFLFASHIFKNQQKPTGKKPASLEEIEQRQSDFSGTFCKITPAFLAALFFAAHPVNTETVAWIGTLPELFMTAMYLSSFFLYITCSPGFNLRFIFSLILFLIAVLFKETALTLFLFILLYDYSKWSIISVLKRYKRYTPYLLIIVGYMALRIHALGGITVRENAKMSVEQLILNFFPLFLQYTKKLLLPFDLKAIYVFHPVNSFSECVVLVAIAFTVLYMTFWYISKKRDSIFFLSLTFIFIPLIPVFYLPAIRDTVFADRYLYLSSFGFVLLSSYIFEKIYLFLNKKGFDSKIVGKGIIFLSLMIMFVYTVSTSRRQPVWKDDFSLWSDTVKKSPDSYVAHNDLGIALGKQGKIIESIAYFSEAQRINPYYTEAYNNMGIALYGLGKQEEAVSQFSKVLQIDPAFAKAHFNLGFVLANQGRMEQAIFHYNKVLQVKPGYPKVRYHLGVVLEHLGKINEAIIQYREELRVKPDWVPALNKLAWILATNENPKYRDTSEAVALAEKANKITGEKEPNTLNLLSVAYAASGQFPLAVKTAEKAIGLADVSGKKKLVKEIKHRLKLYRSGHSDR